MQLSLTSLDEGAVRRTSELFQQAALSGDWERALQGLAGFGGGRAQLIGVGPRASVPFNRAHGIDPAALTEFAERGGGDPGWNPRVRFGLASPDLQVQTEGEFGPLEETLRSEIYADFYQRYQIPFTIQTRLLGGASNVIGLATLHSTRDGLLSSDLRQAFSIVASAARDAVRLSLALEEDRAKLIAGALEAARVAAFLCDGGGQIVAATPAAERLASSMVFLSARQRRLSAGSPQDDRQLQAALWRAAHREGPHAKASQVVLRAPSQTRPLLLEIAPLPVDDFNFGFRASVLVIARTERDLSGLGPVLRQTFDLTASEAEICLQIARGTRLADIARGRAVALETVRSQLKSVAGKLGLARQAEIAAFVNGL